MIICSYCNKQHNEEFCPNCCEPDPSRKMPFRVHITKWDTVNVTVGEYLRSLEEVSKGKKNGY